MGNRLHTCRLSTSSWRIVVTNFEQIKTFRALCITCVRWGKGPTVNPFSLDSPLRIDWKQIVLFTLRVSRDGKKLRKTNNEILWFWRKISDSFFLSPESVYSATFVDPVIRSPRVSQWLTSKVFSLNYCLVWKLNLKVN